ncbi:type IA DNA topoisomerase [Cohnella massiliensis]|uniref:type IA DNA topoisomerase n=1 Tax=Cohnella massiliensis TaxID=1816691 RepID=UPI0009B98C5A|nr:type IA DNA topoisomerase [Cohnella massiliensis]
MKTLVIAEKPDMGRNIASVIEPKAKNMRSYLEGERYIITWAIGHLIGLAEPDRYDDKYKKWNFGDLPIIPEQFKLLPNPKTKDQLAVIRELASRCDSLVNACDAGREGQHIFSLIRRHLGLRQPVRRLWISDLTAETIRRGFEELKDEAEYANLTEAARARSEADWLIGMNGSRAFTTKHNELLSVGRVQTPVLALIYDRQKQIEAFDSMKFYEVAGLFEQGATSYRGLWQGDRILDPAKAEAIAAKAKGKTGAVESYEVKDTKEYPFKLYDLTLLQRDANGKFGFSAKKTLDVAQALYEKHKVISYPRTNSNYVNEENIPEMHRILDSLRGADDYRDFVAGADKRFVHKGNRGVCNPAKVEDHHAIMPTMKRAGALSPDERKVYDLIVRRFLSHFYPAAEYKVHTVMTLVEQERFKTTIKQLLSLGWKALLPDGGAGKDGGRSGKKARGGGGASAGASGSGDKEQEEPLEETDAPFELDASQPVLCADAEAKEKETQPPKHYTEGTLLKAMESAGKQIEDDELRDAMKDSGLGTPATRAATIERLKQVGYIDMQGKKIVITPKGRTAVELIRGAGVELLTSPEMTGQWEKRLNEIARGQASAETFMNNVKRFTVQIVDKVRVQPPAVRTAFGRGEAGGGGGGSAPAGGKSRRAAGKAAGAAAPARTRRRSAVATAAAPAPSAAPAAPAVIGACPRPGCGGQIFMGRKGYGCSHYKTGCSFVIWKMSFGRSLTDAMVRSLIEKGKTGKLKFKNGAGEAYEARILLVNPGTGELALEA